MKKFDVKKIKYDTDQILDFFSLDRSLDGALLTPLLHVKVADNFQIPPQLERKRIRLIEQGNLWNEEELKMHFLSILFDCADIEVPRHIQLFYERPLANKVQDTSLSVVCDALLATPLGINTPKAPYFFLQEFKKGKKSQDDAEGQMLIAMLIAQATNEDNKPIYGCYLQGKDWYFSALQHQNYCISHAYDATRPDELAIIFHVLKNLKNIVL